MAVIEEPTWLIYQTQERIYSWPHLVEYDGGRAPGIEADFPYAQDAVMVDVKVEMVVTLGGSDGFVGIESGSGDAGIFPVQDGLNVVERKGVYLPDGGYILIHFDTGEGSIPESVSFSQPELTLSAGPEPDPDPDPDPDPRNWVSVFDAGPCRVEVYDGTALIPEGQWADYGVWEVNVQEGEVVVHGDNLQGLMFAVVTEFDTGGAETRIRDVQAEIGDESHFAVAGAVRGEPGNPDAGEVVWMDESGSWPNWTYKPNPVEFAGVPGPVLLGIGTGGGG